MDADIPDGCNLRQLNKLEKALAKTPRKERGINRAWRGWFKQYPEISIRKQPCELCGKYKLYTKGLYYLPTTKTFIFNIDNRKGLTVFVAKLIYNKKFRKLNYFMFSDDYIKVCLNCVYMHTGWVCAVHTPLLLKFGLDRQKEFVSIVKGEYNKYVSADSVKLAKIKYLECYIRCYTKVEGYQSQYYRGNYSLIDISYRDGIAISLALMNEHKKAVPMLASTIIANSRSIRCRPDWDSLEDSGEIGFARYLQIVNEYNITEILGPFIITDLIGIILSYI